MGGPRAGSGAQGHVTEQPLLGAAVVAVSEGGDQLVFFSRHVQTLVAVHVQQGEPLRRRRISGGGGGHIQLNRLKYKDEPSQTRLIDSPQLIETHPIAAP